MFFCQKFYAKCLWEQGILVSSKQCKLQNCGDLKLKDKIKQSKYHNLETGTLDIKYFDYKFI